MTANSERRHVVAKEGLMPVYQHRQKVVDLWDGFRNKQTGQPWEHDTMVVVHSAPRAWPP